MNSSTPGLPVHHQLLELAQTHVQRVSEAIQPSHPLSSPFPHREPLPDHAGESPLLSRSGGEKGLRGSGARTLGVPFGGTRRVGGLLGVAGRLSGTVSPFRAEQGTSLETPSHKEEIERESAPLIRRQTSSDGRGGYGVRTGGGCPCLAATPWFPPYRRRSPSLSCGIRSRAQLIALTSWGPHESHTSYLPGQRECPQRWVGEFPGGVCNWALRVV